MKALLVISPGQADVQVVIGGKRCLFAKRKTATIHEELKQLGLQKWNLVESPIAKGEEQSCLPSEDPIALCTPRLDSVLRYAQEANLSFSHALILDTQRSANADKQDPNYAGPILARRFTEDANLDASVKPYLEGNEKLHDATSPHDTLVHRNAVERLNSAIRDAIFDSAPDAIYVVATGGIPQVTALVVNIVRMRAKAPTKVMLLDIADSARSDTGTIERAVIREKMAPSPHVSFEARRVALDLIREGHLIAAWGAVKHLHDDPGENAWTSVIELLYQWASSLPLMSTARIPLLTNPHPKAMDAAMRVEFALRAGDVPRAVHGTVAMVEAAMWDHLLTTHAKLCPGKRDVYSLHPAPKSGLVTMERYGKNSEPFKRIAGTAYTVCHSAASYRRLINEYLSAPNLVRIEGAISQEIRDLRNNVAHGVPTPQQMKQAAKKMQDAKLWSKNKQFLCQPMVQDALHELNVANPEKLCDMLVIEIERLLQSHVYGRVHA